MARPTKLTPKVRRQIAHAVLYGATYKDAAESAGISYETFNVWMKAGRDGESKELIQFSEAIDRANGECAANMAAVVANSAAKGDWRAAVEWLKRRRRGEWGDGVDITSKGDKINDIGVRLIDYRTGIAETETGPEADRGASGEDESTGDGS